MVVTVETAGILSPGKLFPGLSLALRYSKDEVEPGTAESSGDLWASRESFCRAQQDTFSNSCSSAMFPAPLNVGNPCVADTVNFPLTEIFDFSRAP